MLSALIDLCLCFRWLVLVAACGLVAVGLVALAHLDIDAFPDTSQPQVQINTPAPALGPEEVERQITMPIEQALAGLPGLEILRSVSKFGLSQVVVLFSDHTEVYFARQQVSERLTGVVLPAGIERPALGPVSNGLGEVFHYALRYRDLDIQSLSDEERIRRLTELRTLHDWVVKPKLRAVPGVAEVNSWGGYVKQYQVLIDPQKLAKYGLHFDQVAATLGRNNRGVGGGAVRQNSQLLLVQGVGRVTDPAQIGEQVITAVDSVPVRVRDVANIVASHEVRRGAVSSAGRGEVMHGIGFSLTGASVHQVTKGLRQKLEEVRSQLPAEVEVVVLYDRTDLVDFVIATVRRNLFEGGLLVIAVLFAFLGRVRAAIIVALAIPLSMLFAFTGMVRFGIAASLLSLGAIDFGMVVDSSVVLVENCVRHLGEGSSKSRREIVRDAAIEVRKPTLFGELIIIIVYLPILTLEGTEGKLFRPMALTVVFALLGSMLLSLTLIPVLASLVLPKKPEGRMPWPMRVAHALHTPILNLCMNHKFAVVIIAVAVMLFAFGLVAPNLGAEFIPKLSEGAIAIGVVRPAGTDLEESVRVNTLMERALLAEFPQEIDQVWSRIGAAEIATDPMGVELTDLFITLKPRERWKRATNQADLTVLVDKCLRSFPGQRLSFSQPIDMRLSEMETGIRTDVGVKLFGDDTDVLLAKAHEVEATLKAIPGAADVAVEPITPQPLLQIRPKSDAIARYGLSADAVLDWVQAVAGVPAGEAVEGPARIPIVLRLPLRYRNDVQAIKTIIVPTPSGERVPLSRIADIDLSDTPSTINHERTQRRVAISANVRGRDLGRFLAEARAAVAKIHLPSSRYSAEWSGKYEHYESARRRLFIVVPAALSSILILLYLTYGNLTDSLRVLTGVPFGWVGGFIALWIAGLPFSISAAVGFIALSGVAVLDDMILVSYVRQLRKTGMDVHDAVRQAAITRLRPVLMTTLVASLGFLPMALSTGIGAEVQRPLAVVVIGGVIGAMLMSLLVLRVVYLIFDAIAARLGRLRNWFGVGQALPERV